jgi:hypothetical protein
MEIFALIKDKEFTSSVSTRLPLAEPYKSAMNSIRGQWVQIDTQYLFVNQLNTMDGVGTKNGLRLNLLDVDALRIKNGTFDQVKAQIRDFYKQAWHTDVTDIMFTTWKRLLANGEQQQN